MDIPRSTRGLQNGANGLDDLAIRHGQRGIFERVLNDQFEPGHGHGRVEGDQGATIGQVQQLDSRPLLERAARIDDDDGMPAESGQLRWRMWLSADERLREPHDRAAEIGVERRERVEHVFGERDRDGTRGCGKLSGPAAPRNGPRQGCLSTGQMISKRLIVFSALFNVIIVAACGGHGGNSPTPVANAPQITCPTDMTVSEVATLTQDVTFPSPTVTDGAAPVNTTCTPASGTSFPLGPTKVNCTARDAQSRGASCSFNVTLNGFALSVKKFDAIGDSLTAGEIGVTGIVDTPSSYPTKLQALLDSYYPGQGMTVINRGESGQRIERTWELIPSVLSADRPDAVLLLAGYNNLTTPCSTGLAATANCRAAIDFVAVYTRDCIKRVTESPVRVKYVFVSTLTPPGPSGGKRIDKDAIIEVNRRVRQYITSERATLVDSHPVFIGHEGEYVSPDGLHLNPTGYQALAETFFGVIRATIPQTPTLRLR